MTRLESPLILSRSKRQLSALGYKQLNRIIAKACKANNTDRMKKEARPMVEQVRILVECMIFDHNVSKEQLSAFQKAIKVTNGKLELPSIASINI